MQRADPLKEIEMSETHNQDELAHSAPDMAPLAWVIDEIRQSLGHAAKSIERFAQQTNELEHLRAARNLVHQTHGALQLLDLRGVSLLTDGLEQLLQRWEKDSTLFDAAGHETMEQALAAIVAYLEGLLSGQANQPIRLYPYYRSLCILNEASRGHPADLLFPDLTRRPAFSASDVRPLSADQLRVRRAHYEEGLLGFLRNPDNSEARERMHSALADLEHLPLRGLTRSFWWVARGLLDGLCARNVDVDVDLKRVMARLNLQLRRLIDGGNSVAERLMIDVLYYVGRTSSDPALSRVQDVKQLYGLDHLIAENFEQASLTTVDAEALRTIKEALSQAKHTWGQLVANTKPDPAKLIADLTAARGAAVRLAAAPIARVIEAIAQAASDFSKLGDPQREIMALEVASALLFAELGVDALPTIEAEYAERAQTIAARLRAATIGDPLPDAGDWMSELARRAQDRLTMGTVVVETQGALREIEQKLDRFFRNPAERNELADTEKAFNQISGVLSVLGFEEPVAALRQAQTDVLRFVDPLIEPDHETFTRIASNLGALGFFVESLAQDSDATRRMFHFDPHSGIFSADIAHTATIDSAPRALEDEELPSLGGDATGVSADSSLDERPVGATGVPSGVRVESIRTNRVEDAAKQHVRLVHQLAEQLLHAPDDASALMGLGRVMPLLANEAGLLDDAALQQKVVRAVQLLAAFTQERDIQHIEDLHTLFELDSPPQVPAPTAPMPSTQAAADRELHDIFIEEAREVLDIIGEQIEALRAAPDDLAVLTTARRAFHTLKGSSRMVGLKAFGEGAWAVEQCFNLWLSQERAASDALIDLATAAREHMTHWIAQIQSDPHAALDVQALVESAHRVREGGAFQISDAPLPAPAEAKSEATRPKSPGSAPDELPSALPHVDPQVVAPGSSTHPAPEEARPIDQRLDEASEPVSPPPDPAGQASAQSAELRRIGPVQISHGLYAVFLNESDESIRQLAQDIAEWRFEPERAALASTLRCAHSLSGATATVGLTPAHDIAEALEEVIHELSRHDGDQAPRLVAADLDILERAVEKMRGMLHEFAAGVYPKPAPLEAEAVRELFTVLQAQVRPAAAPMRIIRGEDEPSETTAADTYAHAEPIQPESLDESSPAEDALAHETLSEEAPASDPLIANAVHDTLDPELLEIFQTEAHDLLPAIASHLRSLAANPNEREVARELMRQLHTLKGSARMAGAMRLGELVHNMETRIEAAMQLADVPLVIIEALQTQHDQALSLFDRLLANHNTQTHTSTEATAPEPDSEQPTPTEAGLTHKARTASPSAQPPTAAVASAQPAPASFIRVRSDVLDKLVDRAGEVAIARSKLETEIGTLKGSLTDLTENIGRLRGQLREMEIQADAQIQARAGQLDKASDAFDPLEYDRYTRLQELTRMLAESVEDVAMVQTNMIKGLSLADNDLGSQSRITRELQQQLMRVRLVPFSTLSERLYRVARQVSKELDKRVNLEIVGGNIEVDRGVLERMAGPFEHLVRNCIVHGLETAQQRIAAGKAEAGELTIAARQEGNEVIVQVADDGGGIDLERVRIRALERGLIRSDQTVSDRDAMELIFSPGFSTAEAVTELAGRGVGMDVVRSELSSFGGRIAVSSVRGKGTRFTLYLPITLSIAQVVLATVGSRRYALPSGMVEQVRRVRQKQLEPAMATGSITLNPVGEVVLRPLAQLLGEDVVLPTQNKQRPVVLLRSGDDRLAIVVDDVSSSQEVVVKNVGQQVSRLAGILGATIMGNGEIVLIINPVPLIARAPEPVRFEPIPDNAPEGSHGEYARREAPMQAAATVMVVDDSLTVRRVTQRFLERHNFHVMLAKDGVDALRQMQDTLPDIMLVDIEMPRMDGYDLTRNVRSGQATQDIPIIMITSRTAEKHRKVAFEVGVNEYLGKPYQEDELLAHIQHYLSKRHRIETATTEQR